VSVTGGPDTVVPTEPFLTVARANFRTRFCTSYGKSRDAAGKTAFGGSELMSKLRVSSVGTCAKVKIEPAITATAGRRPIVAATQLQRRQPAD